MIRRMASKPQTPVARRIASPVLLLVALAGLAQPLRAGNFDLKDPLILLSGLLQTYDGTAKTVTVSTLPLGLPVKVTYDGSTSAPTNAGSYTVVASIDVLFIHVTVKDTLTISPAITSVRAPADEI